MISEKGKDFLFLHAIVVILGFTAILGKLIELPATGVVFFRTAIAGGLLGLSLLFNADTQAYARRGIIKLLGAGFVLGIHWICFFGSAKWATVAVSLVTFSTTSFFTTLLSPFFTKKPINRIELRLGLGVVLGVYLVFRFEGDYVAGILIGLVGALLAALFSHINAHLTQEFPLRTLTFFQLAGACIPAGVSWALDPTGVWPNSSDWGWLILLGAGCTIGPYLGMAYLLRRISPFTLNLSINMEPLYGIGLAYLIFGDTEKMNLGFYLGGICILITVFGYPLWMAWQERKKATTQR